MLEQVREQKLREHHHALACYEQTLRGECIYVPILSGRKCVFVWVCVLSMHIL